MLIYFKGLGDLGLNLTFRLQPSQLLILRILELITYNLYPTNKLKEEKHKESQTPPFY